MKRMIIAALCLLCMSAVAAHQDDAACMQKGGYIDKEGECILRLQLEVRIEYPLDLAQNPLVAETIDPFIQRSKEAVLNLVTGDFSPSATAYQLDMSYDTVQYSEDIFTLVFSSYVYTGGTHGFTFTETFPFDLANNRLMTLDDLFAPDSDPFGVIVPIVEADLAQKVGDFSDPDWIHEGLSENPDNYQDFALEPDALIFYFDEYEVAPYVVGPQMVSIPLADLSAVLAPEFVP